MGRRLAVKAVSESPGMQGLREAGKNREHGSYTKLRGSTPARHSSSCVKLETGDNQGAEETAVSLPSPSRWYVPAFLPPPPPVLVSGPFPTLLQHPESPRPVLLPLLLLRLCCPAFFVDSQSPRLNLKRQSYAREDRHGHADSAETQRPGTTSPRCRARLEGTAHSTPALAIGWPPRPPLGWLTGWMAGWLVGPCLLVAGPAARSEVFAVALSSSLSSLSSSRSEQVFGPTQLKTEPHLVSLPRHRLATPQETPGYPHRHPLPPRSRSRTTTNRVPVKGLNSSPSSSPLPPGGPRHPPTMVEVTATPIVAAVTSAITTNLPAGLQRAQSRITALQAQRASEASFTPTAIFNRNIAGPGVIGDVKTRPAFRVGQLDTELLDEELLDLLKQQLWGGLKYFRPSIKENYEPEFMAILRAALFKLTIWDNDATYGAALQNLKYVDARSGLRGGDRAPSKTQKVLYGLVTVGGRYLYTRLNLWLLARSNPEDETPLSTRLSNILEHLQTLHSFATLFSFLLFLKNGHYRTILDRILRLRLVAPNRTVSREVSFEYLNRQLVWHAFTEFLLFILPVVKVGRWRRWYSRAMRKARALTTSVTAGIADDSASILKNKNGELGFLPEKTCAICFKETSADAGGASGGSSTDITNPYEAVPCGHLYCYICITSKISLEEGDGWECLRCNTLIKKCRPWKGGLFSDEAAPETAAAAASLVGGKRVGFEGDNGDEDEERAAVNATEDEDDDIPTAVMDTRRESLAENDDELVKFTETLIEDRHHRRHGGRGSKRSSLVVADASASDDDDSPRGPLGESYDNIGYDESESERTERAGSPVLHNWGVGDINNDGDDDEEAVNTGSHKGSTVTRSHQNNGSGSGSGNGGGFLDVASAGFNNVEGSVYDTAGEEDDEEEGTKTPVWGPGRS
ncbi:Pex12 amino terminal region-domain-containing protein [Peziza echinospora]|nr:Pex12 amino terminal region-domain-containing protein [Peziza echinospora]